MTNKKDSQEDDSTPPPPPPPSNTYEFTHAATKLSVSQICSSIGFSHSTNPPLESLTNLTINYILHVGKLSTSFANLHNRTHSNLFDLSLALHHLNNKSRSDNNTCSDSNSCFSDNNTCSVVSSVFLKEIVNYVKSNDESPFTQPLPRFPIVSSKIKKMMIPSFDEIGEEPVMKHVPKWLPAFPDAHTYKETPMWLERAVDLRGDKIEQARGRRKAERALLSLQRKLVCGSGENVKKRRSVVWGDFDGEGTRCSVLSDTEKVDVLGEEGLSVIEAFGAVARDGFCEWKEEEEREREKRRVGVLSRFRVEKKFLGEPVELSLLMKGEERVMSVVREEDRDDKRRRAEFILRQCMENPVDLNQM